MEKYRLLPDKDASAKYGTSIYRVQELKNFGDVKAGQLGGFVHCERNLSNENTCWVYPDAVVLGNANVSGKAQIRKHAVVADCAIVTDCAVVTDCAEILAHAQVVDSAIVTGTTKVMNFSVFDQKTTNLQNTTSITIESKQGIEAKRQALEQELKACEKKIGRNKRYNIMATVSFGFGIYLTVSSNFNNSILGLF